MGKLSYFVTDFLRICIENGVSGGGGVRGSGGKHVVKLES